LELPSILSFFTVDDGAVSPIVEVMNDLLQVEQTYDAPQLVLVGNLNHNQDLVVKHVVDREVASHVDVHW
jgi:hypothetical protein